MVSDPHKFARIGFMQGRLSPLVDGKIQAFPVKTWREEFAQAEQLGLSIMEWTLDQEGLYDNPLMSEAGREEIRLLGERHRVSVPSLTGDCFMQAPFYKANGQRRSELLEDMVNIIKASGDLGIAMILLPLVDDGRLENETQKSDLLEGLAAIEAVLAESGVTLCFESDLPPDRLASFIGLFDDRRFGLTYDIGNSAALGYDPVEEIAAYGDRVLNVHVKDRVLGGATVPLGTGDADISGALATLKDAGYQGNYILQAARANDGDHAGILASYLDKLTGWLGQECEVLS